MNGSTITEIITDRPNCTMNSATTGKKVPKKKKIKIKKIKVGNTRL